MCFRDRLKDSKESPGRRSPRGMSFHNRGAAAEKLMSPNLLCVRGYAVIAVAARQPDVSRAEMLKGTNF